MSIKPNYTIGGSGGSMSPQQMVAELSSLTSPNKLPSSAIENSVLSVNGRTGAVVITPQEVSAQPLNTNLTKLSLAVMSASTLMAMDTSGNAVSLPYTTFGKNLVNTTDDAALRSQLGLSTAATMQVNTANGLLQLDADAKIPLSKINSTFATVATTGSYNDLLNKPTQFSGSYLDLTNKPLMFSGSYIDLTNKPTLSVVAGSGSYNDLLDKPTVPQAQVNSDWNATTGAGAILNKPSIFSGAYSDLTGKPALFTGSYNDLTNRPTLSSVALSGSYVDLANKPNLFSGSYSDLSDKPNLFSGNYADLANAPVIPAAQVSSDWSSTSGVSQILNKPSLFDGNYNSLTNKPVIPTVNYPVTSVNTKTGAVVLTNTDVGAAATVHSHVIGDITGLQSALENKITSGSAIPYASVTGKPTLSNVAISGSYVDLTNKPILFSGSYTDLTSKPTFATVATTGAYSDLTGAPTIPTNTTQLTNGSGYITAGQAPVQSVNTKTGAVNLTYTDVAAAPIGQGTRYIRATNTQATGVKVKYYLATSDSLGGWALSLGTDFTEIMDVQVQAVSSSGITGIRQATINSYTSSSTSLSGSTYGNMVLTTVLIGVGANTLSLIGSTPVKIRVEGIGA